MPITTFLFSSNHAECTRKANLQKTKVNATKTRKVFVDKNKTSPYRILGKTFGFYLTKTGHYLCKMNMIDPENTK